YLAHVVDLTRLVIADLFPVGQPLQEPSAPAVDRVAELRGDGRRGPVVALARLDAARLQGACDAAGTRLVVVGHWLVRPPPRLGFLLVARPRLVGRVANVGIAVWRATPAPAGYAALGSAHAPTHRPGENLVPLQLAEHLHDTAVELGHWRVIQLAL